MKWILHNSFYLLSLILVFGCSDDDIVEKKVNQIGKWGGFRDYIRTDSNGIVNTKSLFVWFELREDRTGTINFVDPSQKINDISIDLWVLEENQKRIELTITNAITGSKYIRGFRIDKNTKNSQRWTEDTVDSIKLTSRWRVSRGY